MIKGLLIRCGVAALLIYHGYIVYTETGYDDFLPIRIVYVGTVIFHAYHLWQYRQYMRERSDKTPWQWPND